MKALLLPGLDGTGALHGGFAGALEMDCEVARYPAHLTSYSEIREYLTPLLPAEPFILIAESFSGPLAIQIASAHPAELRGVVFVASFAQAPRPAPACAASVLRFMPMKSRLACQMMQPAVMGRWANHAFTNALWAALETVPTKTMAARLAEVLRADKRAALGTVEVPMLYLRAMSDRLVARKAARPFEAAGGQIQDIEGPHFLLQALPEMAAAAIRSFVNRLGLETAQAST